MQKKNIESNNLDPSYLPCNQLDKSSGPPLNYFDCSSLLHNGIVFPDTLGSIHSFSLKDFNLSHLQEPKDPESYNFERENAVYFQDESPFQVMTFNRGFSEAYEPLESNKPRRSQALEVELGNLPEQNLQSLLPEPKGEKSNPNCCDQSGQEFKSNSINSPTSWIQKKKESRGSEPRGSVVKNVTKNIGKLLMKFIWKNRNTLKCQMKPEERTWEVFLSLVKTWKKENNITREFLVSRWQGRGEEFKLFRVVSHHFFRKHCLSAILKSNIQEKRVHFERVHKFYQAIVDPRALQYLA